MDEERPESGFALILIILVAMAGMLLVVTMTRNVLADVGQLDVQRRITNGRAAADAGIDQVMFEMG